MIRVTTNPPRISKQIAIQHLAWAKKVGFDNAAVMRSIGIPSPNCEIEDHAVVDALERTWLALQVGWDSGQVIDARNHRYKRAAE